MIALTIVPHLGLRALPTLSNCQSPISSLGALAAAAGTAAAGQARINGCAERAQKAILDECWRLNSARYMVPSSRDLT